MPTAEEFRLGVADTTTELSSIAATQRLCDLYVDDFGFSGGASSVVKDAFVAGSGNAATIGRLTDALIEEMNRKARLCDQYTAAMATFASAHYVWAERNQTYREAPRAERANLWPGREPQPPEAPFAGAMVSP